jgi:hypothetical protein
MAFPLPIHISPKSEIKKKENWLDFDFGGASILLKSQGGQIFFKKSSDYYLGLAT